MMAVRSFVAIECPVEIKEEIQALQQELKMTLLGRAQGQEGTCLPAGRSEDQHHVLPHGPPQINWTRPEGFHLTLKFLGNVEEDRISKIAQAIRGVTDGFSIFTVSIGEVGVFPHTRSPRVIWVGAKSVGDDLVRLQEGIEKVLVPLGFPPQDRPFHPHLTLGRIKSDDRRRDLGFDKKALTQWLLENQKRECDRFEAKEVLLIKSDLQPSGAVYTSLAKLRLVAQSEASQGEPLA